MAVVLLFLLEAADKVGAEEVVDAVLIMTGVAVDGVSGRISMREHAEITDAKANIKNALNRAVSDDFLLLSKCLLLQLFSIQAITQHIIMLLPVTRLPIRPLRLILTLSYEVLPLCCGFVYV